MIEVIAGAAGDPKWLVEDFHNALESGRIRHMVKPLNR
jgi:hypothetical protein